ncbi:MAG: succinylglutamate desuccinylase/aspartoacylase family protein [Candidatus Colwellbacteria bacterium]|nr:succinylglutamate desuccinylase/aspartoacylase family protein [Candidatus Colwellbacteria bacterium]
MDKESLILVEGQRVGPSSVILTGVHGDERCGIDAVERVLPDLKIESGKVWVGYGNPQAVEQNVRFAEANLNRMFKPDDTLSKSEKNSYEYGRAQYLKKYLDEVDVLLDIHASFTPNARPFVLCEMNAFEIVKYLPFDLMVTGFDNVEPGGTDYYMNRMGKIGICVECGYIKDPASTVKAEESIFSFLKARGHITGETKAALISHIHMYQLYITKTDKFSLTKPFGDFEPVAQGKIIGKDGNDRVVAPKNSVILFARNCTRKGEEAFLLGEEMDSPA